MEWSIVHESVEHENARCINWFLHRTWRPSSCRFLIYTIQLSTATMLMRLQPMWNCTSFCFQAALRVLHRGANCPIHDKAISTAIYREHFLAHGTVQWKCLHYALLNNGSRMGDEPLQWVTILKREIDWYQGIEASVEMAGDSISMIKPSNTIMNIGVSKQTNYQFAGSGPEVRRSFGRSNFDI